MAVVAMQALMQEDPQKARDEARIALKNIFDQNRGDEKKNLDGLFRGIGWQGTAMNYSGRIGVPGTVGVILPKEKIENSKWLSPVVDQFISALEKIGLTVTNHGWMTTNTGKDYYGFYVEKGR